MKIKLLLSSMFYYVNIGILLILLGVGNLVKEYLGIPAFYIVCAEAVIYIGLVLKSFTSKKFQDRFLLKMKQRNIKKLNKKCMVLASEATRYTNAAYYRKLSSLLNDKNEIIKSYNRDKSNYLRGKIAEQALSLVVSYIHLLKDFCIRSREAGKVNVNAIMDRITQNNRKLNFINDSKVYDDIKRIIEMDMRIIERHKEEKSDLERVDARLECIKSTVSMLRHQINSGLDLGENLENVENILNEAVALENVLNERNKKRLRN
ncbi:MAG TPA: hypothetical protein PK033_01580 [Acetivibrio sp.]|nr:hypothetical protein [Acetivibrio sp.]